MFNGQSLEEITDTLSALQKTLEESDLGRPKRTFHTMDEVAYERAIQGQLDSLSHRLDSLSLVLKDTVERMQHALSRPTSNHVGLMSLPTELLVHIIELVAAEEYQYDFRETRTVTGRLSLVSRTFRRLVVNTASLWAKLDADYCLSGGFATRVGRSKDASMVLDLKVASTWEWQRFLATALPFRHRCRDVNLYLNDSVAGALKLHPHMSFPRAEVAQISFEHRDNFDLFFADWSFPAVKRLKLISAVPPPGIFTDVTRLSLKVTEESFGKVYHRITVSLKHLHNLHDLSIHLPSCVYQEEIQVPESPPVNLPTVTSLVISNASASVGDPRIAFAAGKLFKAIKAPNASTIRLEVAHLEEEDIATWLQSFPPTEVAFAKVEHITYYSCGRLTSSSLARFLKLFPNARTLNLEIPAIVSTIAGIYEDECPGLDRLCEFDAGSCWRPPPEPWILEQVVDRLTDYPNSVTISSRQY